MHLEVVLLTYHRNPGLVGCAYYYHFDIPASDWYYKVHQVDVDWASVPDGAFPTLDIREIGGTWRRAFDQVKNRSQ